MANHDKQAEVAKLLTRCGLASYIGAFREHQIHLADMFHLTDKSLEVLFPHIGDRIKFKENLKQFHDQVLDNNAKMIRSDQRTPKGFYSYRKNIDEWVLSSLKYITPIVWGEFDSPASPDDSPISPDDSPASPDDSPISPDDSPISPDDSPASPDDSPISPDDSPASPDDSPYSPVDSPASPVDSDDFARSSSVEVNKEKPERENFSIRFKRVLRSENRPILKGRSLDQKGDASASGRSCGLAVKNEVNAPKRVSGMRKLEPVKVNGNPEKKLRKIENVGESIGTFK